MKVALILDRQASEQVVAGADAYWLISSPENRQLAERLRKTDVFDLNSAVFDGDLYVNVEDAAVGVLHNIHEHHPEWTEIYVVGVEPSAAMRATLRDLGRVTKSTPYGFVVMRTS
jgi:hypothetical protein